MKLPASLDETANTVFLVDRQGLLVDHNAAYLRFAADNDGGDIATRWGRGCNVFDCLPAVLRSEITALYARAIDGTVADYRYQCHSPELHRIFSMRLLPFAEGFVLAEHALLASSLMVGVEQFDDDEIGRRFIDGNGMITQCCSCRKVRLARSAEEWLWVESLFCSSGDRPGRISHGLCPVCLEWRHPG